MLLKAVGDMFKISPELAENKYVNIRTVCGRFLKKDASGSGREDDPRRAMYAQLAWLKPYIKQNNTFTNLSSLDDENVQFVVPSQRSDVDNFNLDGDAETTNISETIDDLNDDDAFNVTMAYSNEEIIGEEIVVSSSNMLTTQTTINSSSASKHKGKEKKRKCLEDEFMKACQAIQNTQMQNKQQNDCHDDECSLHMRSLADGMRRLPRKYQRQLRLSIENLFFEAETLHEEEQNI